MADEKTNDVQAGVNDSCKATSPSPAVQTAIDKNWNGGTEAGKTPQEALANRRTKDPINPSTLK